MQEKLILLRKTKKVSQEELAKIVGISPKQFGLKENGIYKFNGDEMFRISEYFDMKLEDIFLPTYHQNGELFN